MAYNYYGDDSIEYANMIQPLCDMHKYMECHQTHSWVYAVPFHEVEYETPYMLGTDFNENRYVNCTEMIDCDNKKRGGSMETDPYSDPFNEPLNKKRKRKRILNQVQRIEATRREKKRMMKLNVAFEELRAVLPLPSFAKAKLSRVETLRSAIDYIESMLCLLNESHYIPFSDASSRQPNDVYFENCIDY